eukprot:TRINITY_DN21079_c0_g1_i1.p2 TRINITY_DN21079_c0_g1~~TRINITY_DN21079_c0_g1_i1.p2  ORF type:complete len:131 (-),score=28.47 TRINITY_DN21079_c0_g1_i1:109-501(-)
MAAKRPHEEPAAGAQGQQREAAAARTEVAGDSGPARKEARRRKAPAEKTEKRVKKAKAEKGGASSKQDKLRLKLAAELMEGPPGTGSPRPLPLSLLAQQQCVAWQWKEGGKMQYPIPIGSTRPLSPFSSD